MAQTSAVGKISFLLCFLGGHITIHLLLSGTNTPHGWFDPRSGLTVPLRTTDVRKGSYVEIGNFLPEPLPSGFPKARYSLDLSKRYDLCSVGAGLSGTVFAERAANELSKSVLIFDHRPHIGGNCYDFVDPKTSILRNLYGNHMFHTNDKRVYQYVTKFSDAPKWTSWYHKKFGLVNGTYVPIPANIETVNMLFGVNIKTEEEMKQWLEEVQVPCPESGCQDGAQMAKSRVGERLYEAIFKDYTFKQWGKYPSELNASVTGRIPLRADFDPRYFSHKYQILPSRGYTAWFAAVLDHPLIDVVLSVDFFDHKEHLEKACKKSVYTGPIDRYFQGLEKLEYRSIQFTEERYYHHPGYVLPTPVVNYPGLETNYTRAVEYKQLLHRGGNHSIVVKETSADDGEPYYPVPSKRNLELYAKYASLAESLEQTGNILFVGRLANYKYFDMDQAIANALKIFDKTFPPKGASAPAQPVLVPEVWQSLFRGDGFQTYRAWIDGKIRKYRQEQSSHSQARECRENPPRWLGEFGMELRVFVPWAYWMSQQCLVRTSGTPGTKYMYFFSHEHVILKEETRSFKHLPPGNPFNSSTVHIKDFPMTRWRAPPFNDFFRRQDATEMLRGRPLVVILNKYTEEWQKKKPINFMSVDLLDKVLAHLTPKYNVMYKRHTHNGLVDHHGTERDLGEKLMIRGKYPSVVMFEDLAVGLQDAEDDNLLLFGLLSTANIFLTVQGGTAVVGSFFGGVNIILIHKGFELKAGDYGYFHRFSNATVLYSTTDEQYLEMVKERAP